MALIEKITNIADAIRSKTGTTDTMTLAQMPELINGIQTGGGGSSSAVSPKEVNFYDYDGKLRYAYTVAEAQKLSALPAGPQHPGLVFLLTICRYGLDDDIPNGQIIVCDLFLQDTCSGNAVRQMTIQCNYMITAQAVDPVAIKMIV